MLRLVQILLQHQLTAQTEILSSQDFLCVAKQQTARSVQPLPRENSTKVGSVTVPQMLRCYHLPRLTLFRGIPCVNLLTARQLRRRLLTPCTVVAGFPILEHWQLLALPLPACWCYPG